MQWETQMEIYHIILICFGLVTQHKQLQGGFVWDWIDQGLEYSEGLGYGYGGDFGPNSGKGDKQFCINGVCFPDRTGKPALEELNIYNPASYFH